MGWIVKTSAVMGMLAAAGVSAGALTQAAGKEKPAQEQERRVWVQERAPGAQILRLGGPRLGVALQEVTEEAARQRKLQSVGGALVAEVSEETPAAEAGVREGDVIVEFDGERVRSVRQLQRLVSETPAGRAVKIVVSREGQRVELTATLEERQATGFVPGIDQRRLEEEIRRGVDEGVRHFRFELPDKVPELRVQPGPGMLQWFGGTGRLGASVQNLSPQLRDYFGAPDGVLVSSVEPESAAAQAGLKAGDVIVSAGGSKVSTPGDLAREVRTAKEGAELEIGIVRDRKQQTLKAKLPPSTRGSRPI